MQRSLYVMATGLSNVQLCSINASLNCIPNPAQLNGRSIIDVHSFETGVGKVFANWSISRLWKITQQVKTF